MGKSLFIMIGYFFELIYFILNMLLSIINLIIKRSPTPLVFFVPLLFGSNLSAISRDLLAPRCFRSPLPLLPASACKSPLTQNLFIAFYHLPFFICYLHIERKGGLDIQGADRNVNSVICTFRFILFIIIYKLSSSKLESSIPCKTGSPN